MMNNSCKYDFRMDAEVRSRYKNLSIANNFFKVFILLLRREQKYCPKAALLFGGSASSEE